MEFSSLASSPSASTRVPLPGLHAATAFLRTKGRRAAVLSTLWRDEAGLTTVEYALILFLVAIAAVTTWATLGSRVNGLASPAASSLPGN